MVVEEGSSPMDRTRVRNYRRSIICQVVSLTALALVLMLPARGQDGNTSLQGIVEDLTGARIAHAEVTVLKTRTMAFITRPRLMAKAASVLPCWLPDAIPSQRRRQEWRLPASPVWNCTLAARCSCNSVCARRGARNTSLWLRLPRLSIPTAARARRSSTSKPSRICRSMDAVSPIWHCCGRA